MPSKEDATKNWQKKMSWSYLAPGYLTVTLSRDFDDQMHQNAAFPEAENILWI
jgi:hypothetical protein